MTTDTLTAPVLGGSLRATTPFSLGQTTRVLAGDPPCRGDFDCSPTELSGALTLSGRPYLLRIRPAPDGLGYRIVGAAEPDPGDEAALREVIGAWLSLDDDIAAFYEVALADPDFAPIVRSQWGLHHVRYLTLAECVCWLVLTQGTRRPLARVMKRRLVDRWGSSITVGQRRFTTFPELEQLASIEAVELGSVVGHERKGETLAAALRAVVELTPAWLATAPIDEAAGALLAVKGIGPFTSDGILMRGLGRMGRLASIEMPQFSDPGRRVYGPGFDPDEIRACYGDWVGYWAYYLRNSGA